MADIIFGCDIARFGDDSTVIAMREFNRIYPLVVLNKLDNVEVAGRIQDLAKTYKPKIINVDVIGLGAGVKDILRSNHYPANGVNVGETSEVVDEKGNRMFANLRAELWWTLREELDPKNKNSLLLPPDDELLADLASPTFDYTPKGAIQIEPKDKTKERLGRSPDRGDAVMLTFAPLTKRSPSKVGLIQPAPSKMITPAYRIPGAGIPSRQIG